MSLGFLWWHGAGLLVLAGLGLWWGLGPAPPAWAWVLIPGLALLLLALAGLHMGLRARAWSGRQAQLTRQGEDQLERARQTQQAVLDHSGDLIFTLDPQGRYLGMNRWGLGFLATSGEYLAGKFIEEHLDSASAARLRDLMREALASGQARRHLEPLNLGGRPRFMEVFLKKLEARPGQEPQILGILRDQTEAKLAEERMWQTEKLASLGLLAAGVAHQINNPLGILMGFTQLLIDQTPDEAPGRRELGIILEQGGECKKIVDGLLNFTRLSDLGGGGDLLAGLRGVIDTVGPVLESRGIGLDLDLPADLPYCPASGGAMQQVFLNLISNAMDAMPQGGRLAIAARARRKEPRQGSQHGTLPQGPRYMEISMQDSGTGIDPDMLDRIYDPFFTTKPEGQGTGLGLSVAYGIVREHQGTITCQSPPPGQPGPGGARFVIRLPLPGDQAAQGGRA